MADLGLASCPVYASEQDRPEAQGRPDKAGRPQPNRAGWGGRSALLSVIQAKNKFGRYSESKADQKPKPARVGGTGGGYRELPVRHRNPSTPVGRALFGGLSSLAFNGGSG